jgi:hypothetical protein
MFFSAQPGRAGNPYLSGDAQASLLMEGIGIRPLCTPLFFLWVSLPVLVFNLKAPLIPAVFGVLAQRHKMLMYT